MTLTVRPLVEAVVTSAYGPRVIAGVDNFHDGTDYRAAVGTPLYAMGDGVVTAAGFGVGGDGGGNAIAIVDDDDGQLFFLHLDDVAVRPGDRVRAGMQIGTTGDSGRVTGPHLHLQWRPLWPDRRTQDIGPVVEALPSPVAGGGAVPLLALGVAGALWLKRRRRR